jgi:hypothetical protein
MQTEGRTDGRTDMTKLKVAFRNFANAPKNMVVTGTKNDKCTHMFRQIKNKFKYINPPFFVLTNITLHY